MMSQQAPPGWFPDSSRRFEHRYWDGVKWTEHVGTSGNQSVDPLSDEPPRVPHAAVAVRLPSQPTTAAVEVFDKKVQRQIRNLGVRDPERSGGGSLFTEPILVINQKAKFFEKKAEYSVFNQHGQKVGGVRQFGMSMSRIAVGRDNATKRLQIVDAQARPLLTLTRPATVLKSKVIVTREDGIAVGQIVQENFGVMASVLGGRFNIRFRMESEGETFGTINAESWKAWDFSIQDPHGAEVARITKTWAGLGRESFTKADNYVLEMHRELADPLLTLVVSAALAVDTVLNQDSDRRRR